MFEGFLSTDMNQSLCRLDGPCSELVTNGYILEWPEVQSESQMHRYKIKSIPNLLRSLGDASSFSPMSEGN